MADKKQYYHAVGRRKEASATVRLTRGEGKISVNGRPAEEYFASPRQADKLAEPFKQIAKEKDYDVSLKVNGGGQSGQADACQLAIAKALINMDEDLRPILKKAGLLTRDARVKERKKYGLKRARKAPQFTKR